MEIVTPDLLTVEQAADLLQVPKSWVYLHVREPLPGGNRLPYLKFGKYLRFQRDKLLAWAAEQGR